MNAQIASLDTFAKMELDTNVMKGRTLHPVDRVYANTVLTENMQWVLLELAAQHASLDTGATMVSDTRVTQGHSEQKQDMISVFTVTPTHFNLIQGSRDAIRVLHAQPGTWFQNHHARCTVPQLTGNAPSVLQAATQHQTTLPAAPHAPTGHTRTMQARAPAKRSLCANLARPPRQSAIGPRTTCAAHALRRGPRAWAHRPRVATVWPGSTSWGAPPVPIATA